MSLSAYKRKTLPKIEKALKECLQSQQFGLSQPLKEMLATHMGWRDDGEHGKRLRPLIALICTEALGGKVKTALPAALAVELLHNFSLIHDDIEDRSPTRHGRQTLWTRWGEAQAINAGDALFSIAQLSMLDLAEVTNPQVALKTAKIFNQTCFQLIRGQYLDIAFEKEENIDLESYLEMIHGKTAALISFSTAVGGWVTESKPSVIDLLEKYGESLGLAFQIQDDFLGIWGDPKITGKSIASDLLTKKKTLPVLFGLQNCDAFKDFWVEDEINADNVASLSSLLESCGAKEYVREKAKKYTADAFDALETLFPTKKPENEPAEALVELSGLLLHRNY